MEFVASHSKHGRQTVIIVPAKVAEQLKKLKNPLAIAVKEVDYPEFEELTDEAD